MSETPSHGQGSAAGFDLARTETVLAASSTAARIAELQGLEESITRKGTLKNGKSAKRLA